MLGFLTFSHLRRLSHHVPALSLSLSRSCSVVGASVPSSTVCSVVGTSVTRPAPSKLESTTFSVAAWSTALRSHSYSAKP
ncbi:hypothetical protein U1Q18_001558 [Sarracenia purpurea var. burkii]